MLDFFLDSDDDNVTSIRTQRFSIEVINPLVSTLGT